MGRNILRVCLAAAVIALLALSGSIEPAAAQCDPVVCANPYGWGAKAHRPRHHHHRPKAGSRPPQPKAQSKYLQY